jgi:hypothetical protein
MFARWLPTVFWSANLQEGAASCRASSYELGVEDQHNSVHYTFSMIVRDLLCPHGASCSIW